MVVVGLQHVSRQLLLHKLVIRQVVVERPNHPVAVVVRTGTKAVELIPAALGEPGHVEPVPRPLLTVVLAGQQLVDHFLERLRRCVVDEGVDLLRRRWQPNEIEVCATDELLFRRRAVRLQLLSHLRGENKIVDRRLDARTVRHGGRRHRLQRLERPPFATLGNVDLTLRLDRHGSFARVGRTHVDPLHEVGNDLVRELSLRRHLDPVVLQRLDEPTFGRLPFDEGWPVLASDQRPGRRIEEQPRPDDLLRIACLHRMATVTVLHQHGPNLHLEELQPFLGCRLGQSGHRGERGRDRQESGDDPALSHSMVLTVCVQTACAQVAWNSNF